MYAVDARIVHERDKRICMGWEHEQTLEEAKEALHAHLHPEDDQHAFVSSKEMRELEKRIDATYNEHTPWSSSIGTGPSEHWCKWCAAFATGCPSFVTRAEFSVSHSYSNPIWSSQFHFFNMHPGSLYSDMANRFVNGRCYKEIAERDVADLESDLERRGTAYCTQDREALDETRRFIAFARSWLAASSSKENDVGGVVLLYDADR